MFKSLPILIISMAGIASAVLPASAQQYGYPRHQLAGDGQQYVYDQQPGMSQEMQFLQGEWSLQTQQGRTASEFFPDGSFRVMHFANGDRKGQFATGRYQVKPMGNGRFELSLMVQGAKQPYSNMMEIRNGQLYNATAKAFAQRTGQPTPMR